jgi:hypothetical protein
MHALNRMRHSRINSAQSFFLYNRHPDAENSSAPLCCGLDGFRLGGLQLVTVPFQPPGRFLSPASSLHASMGPESRLHPRLLIFSSTAFQMASTTSRSRQRLAAPAPAVHGSTCTLSTPRPQRRTVSGGWSPRQPTYTPIVCRNRSNGSCHL